MRVRRGAVPVLLWCLATAASIGVASLALRPVLRTAVPDDSVPVAAGEQGRREVVTQTLPAQPTPSSPPPAIIADPSSAFAPPSSATPTRSAAGPTPGKPTTAAPARVVDGWTVTTGSDGVDVYLRSFRSEGGDAVVRIRGGVVSLV